MLYIPRKSCLHHKPRMFCKHVSIITMQLGWSQQASELRNCCLQTNVTVFIPRYAQDMYCVHCIHTVLIWLWYEDDSDSDWMGGGVQNWAAVPPRKQRSSSIPCITHVHTTGMSGCRCPIPPGFKKQLDSSWQERKFLHWASVLKVRF